MRILEPFVQIRRLFPMDAALFQALRLFALLDTPHAFASSYEEEASLAVSHIETRLIEKPDQGIWGAFDGGELVGMLGLKRENMRKLSHKVNLWGMYVAPDARNKGVARALLLQVLTVIQSMPEIIQVNLTVNATNIAAVKLYESEGFVVFGREPCALMVDGELHDELHMCLC